MITRNEFLHEASRLYEQVGEERRLSLSHLEGIVHLEGVVPPEYMIGTVPGIQGEVIVVNVQEEFIAAPFRNDSFILSEAFAGEEAKEILLALVPKKS